MLRKLFALTEQGAKDLKKGIIALSINRKILLIDKVVNLK